MTDINVDLTVNTTSVEVTDASGEVLELTPQENVTVVVEESSGSGGGGSYTLLTDSEYEEFRRDMELKILTLLPTVETDPETEEK